jgi:hypothetical protein
MTSRTRLLISSFDKPAEAAYPLVANVNVGRAKVRAGRMRGVVAIRKEGADRRIAVRNILRVCVGIGMGIGV